VANGPCTLVGGSTFKSTGVGACTLQATSAETANFLSASSTRIVSVLYAAGLCLGEAGHQILQPINTDGSSVFKQGSIVPAKFRVCDANGKSIGTPGLVSSFVLSSIDNTPATGVNEEVLSTAADTAFRWDPRAMEWIFNISTKNLSANRKYSYLITLNDGTWIQFRFGLK
jgi:hypothetical protein